MNTDNKVTTKTKNKMKTNTIPSEVVEYLSSYYETYNTLPTPVLECTKGSGAYTAFGTNLKKKVEKAGSIESLLTTFVGRGAKKEMKKVSKTTGRSEAVVTIKTT